MNNFRMWHIVSILVDVSVEYSRGNWIIQMVNVYKIWWISTLNEQNLKHDALNRRLLKRDLLAFDIIT